MTSSKVHARLTVKSSAGLSGVVIQSHVGPCRDYAFIQTVYGLFAVIKHTDLRATRVLPTPAYLFGDVVLVKGRYKTISRAEFDTATGRWKYKANKRYLAFDDGLQVVGSAGWTLPKHRYGEIRFYNSDPGSKQFTVTTCEWFSWSRAFRPSWYYEISIGRGTSESQIWADDQRVAATLLAR